MAADGGVDSLFYSTGIILDACLDTSCLFVNKINGFAVC